MRKLATIAALAMATAAAMPAHAALLDGSFEAQGAAANYNGGSYCYFNPVSGAPAICNNAGSPWGGDAGLIQSGSGPWGGTAAFDGGFYSFVQGGGSLTQIFSVATTGSYLLSWVDAHRTNNGGPQNYSVSLGDATGAFLANSSAWTDRSLLATLVGGQSYTLTFQGLSNVDTTAFIDAVGLSGVPEPTTWAMMIGGFGLVGGAMRRRAGKVRVAFA